MSINCQELSYAYDKKPIIEKISFELKDGQFASITGPNGIGKSTLIKCLANIYKPDNGTVYLNGQEIALMNAQELAKTLGYVPQKEETNFSLTVYEMVLLGRRPYIKWKVKISDEKIVEKILERLKILHLAEREVSTLSGGEKQKVAIARALAQEPSIILLDEPTSSLDINHQIELMEVLRDLVDFDQVAVVAVLHDLNLASSFSDIVYLLGEEGIHAAGRPEKVFTPQTLKIVYGINVEIIKGTNSRYIVPLRSKVSKISPSQISV